MIKKLFSGKEDPGPVEKQYSRKKLQRSPSSDTDNDDEKLYRGTLDGSQSHTRERSHTLDLNESSPTLRVYCRLAPEDEDMQLFVCDGYLTILKKVVPSASQHRRQRKPGRGGKEREERDEDDEKDVLLDLLQDGTPTSNATLPFTAIATAPVKGAMRRSAQRPAEARSDRSESHAPNLQHSIPLPSNAGFNAVPPSPTRSLKTSVPSLHRDPNANLTAESSTEPDVPLTVDFTSPRDDEPHQQADCALDHNRKGSRNTSGNSLPPGQASRLSDTRTQPRPVTNQPVPILLTQAQVQQFQQAKQANLNQSLSSSLSPPSQGSPQGRPSTNQPSSLVPHQQPSPPLSNSQAQSRPRREHSSGVGSSHKVDSASSPSAEAPTQPFTSAVPSQAVNSQPVRPVPILTRSNSNSANSPVNVSPPLGSPSSTVKEQQPSPQSGERPLSANRQRAAHAIVRDPSANKDNSAVLANQSTQNQSSEPSPSRVERPPSGNREREKHAILRESKDSSVVQSQPEPGQSRTVRPPSSTREREKHVIVREPTGGSKDSAVTRSPLSNPMPHAPVAADRSLPYAPTPLDSNGRVGMGIPLVADAPLEFVEVLCDAAWNNHLEEMRQIMKSTAAMQLAGLTDRRGQTALQCAVHRGHKQMVLELLLHGVDIGINSQDKRGDTALSNALFYDRPEIVCLLLLAGADVTIKNHDNLDWIERYKGLVERPTESNRETERVVVRFLNEGIAGIVSYFPIGQEYCAQKTMMPLITQVHRAIRCGDFKQFNELLQNKPKKYDSFDALAIVNTLDLDGKSFLSTAAMVGNLNILRALLQAGADVDLPDRNGDRPLYVACMHENKEAVAYLLMHGASRDAIPKLDNLIKLDWFREAFIQFNTDGQKGLSKLSGNLESFGCEVMARIFLASVVKAVSGEPVTVPGNNGPTTCYTLMLHFNNFQYMPVYLTHLPDMDLVIKDVERKKRKFIPLHDEYRYSQELMPRLFPYDASSELDRLGLDRDVWEIKDGRVIGLRCIPDQETARLVDFHFRGIYLSLVWGRAQCGGLFRCERPNVFLGTEDTVDLNAEHLSAYSEYLESIFTMFNDATQRPKEINIFDTGPPNPEMVVSTIYSKYHFLDINDRFIRRAFGELVSCCGDVNSKKRAIIEKIQDSTWFRLVKIVVQVCCSIVKLMKKDSYVVIQSGGPDSYFVDSMISIIVQVSFDAHYRTIAGFCELLRKDWFSESITSLYYDTNGHGTHIASSGFDFGLTGQGSMQSHVPTFFLLVTCLYQMVLEFEDSFEYNANFLFQLFDDVIATRVEPTVDTRFTTQTFAQYWRDHSKKNIELNDHHYYAMCNANYHHYELSVHRIFSRVLECTSSVGANGDSILNLYYNKAYNFNLDIRNILNNQIVLPYEKLLRFHPSTAQTKKRFAELVVEYQKSEKTSYSGTCVDADDVDWGLLWNVESLFLSGSFLSKLPHSFMQLRCLTTLSLENCQFSQIPRILLQIPSVTSLNMTFNKITQIPSWIDQLASLQSLNLDSNSIEHLGTMPAMTALRSLSMNGNRISILSPALSQGLKSLTSLEIKRNLFTHIPGNFLRAMTPDVLSLNFSNNNLAVLPLHWNTLQNLTMLNFYATKLTFLPESLAHCQALTHLIIGKNRFVSLPKVIGELINLKFLDAYDNRIVEIPYWLGKLKMIEEINFGKNNLLAVAHQLSQLKRLKCLNLSNNKITEIPSTLSSLEKTLVNLILKGNPLRNLAEGEMTTKQLMSLLVQRQKETVPFEQSMIMMLGPEGSGKTKVLNDLVNASKRWNHIPGSPEQAYWEEQYSQHVTVNHYKFNYAKIVDPNLARQNEAFFALGRKKAGTIDPSDVTRKVVNRFATLFTWDFRSNEIMEGLFSLFYRPRCLLIVTFNITEANFAKQFRKWMLFIKASRENSDVLVVFTHLDKLLRSESKKVNATETAPQNRYSAEIVAVLKANEDVTTKFRFFSHFRCDQIETITVTLVLYLNEIYSQSKPIDVPSSQLFSLMTQVGLKKLEEKSAPILSQNELAKLGHACNLMRLDTILKRVRILHNAGAITYFQFSATQKDIVILNNVWFAYFLGGLLDYKGDNFVGGNGIIGFKEVNELIRKCPAYLSDCALHVFESFHFIKSLPNEKYFLFSRLGKDEPYNVTLQTILKKEFTDESPHIKRKFQFICLPGEFFSIYISSILEYLTTSQRLTQVTLSLWKLGLHAAIHDTLTDPTGSSAAGLCTIRIERAMDSDNQAVTIAVRANVANTSRTVMTELLELFTLQVMYFKLKCQDFVEINKELVPTSDLESFISKGELNYRTNRKISYHLFDLVPDRTMFSFNGKRVSLEELNLSNMKELGKGGYATVYGGRVDQISGLVAVKVMNASEGEEAALALSEFMHEVTIQGALRHPNIVSIQGIVMKPPCLLMELLIYGELKRLLSDYSQGISWALRVKFALDIAMGVDYLQNLNPPIAHIDLKTPNVLLSSVDFYSPVCAKIADFGTSRPIVKPIRVKIVDNPIWQAPEVLNGEPYDHKIDIYALGIIFWEIVARKSPFHQYEFHSDISHMVAAGMRPEIPDCCPHPFRQLIQACWNQNPFERPYGARMSAEVLTPLRALFNKPQQYAALFEAQDRELLAQMKVKLSDYFQQLFAVGGADASQRFQGAVFLLEPISVVWQLRWLVYDQQQLKFYKDAVNEPDNTIQIPILTSCELISTEESLSDESNPGHQLVLYAEDMRVVTLYFFRLPECMRWKLFLEATYNCASTPQEVVTVSNDSAQSAPTNARDSVRYRWHRNQRKLRFVENKFEIDLKRQLGELHDAHMHLRLFIFSSLPNDNDNFLFLGEQLEDTARTLMQINEAIIQIKPEVPRLALILESKLNEKQDLEFKWLAINKEIQEQNLAISGDDMLKILKSNSKNAMGEVSEVKVDKKDKRKVVTLDQQIVFGEEMLNFYKEQEEESVMTDSLPRYRPAANTGQYEDARNHS